MEQNRAEKIPPFCIFMQRHKTAQETAYLCKKVLHFSPFRAIISTPTGNRIERTKTMSKTRKNTAADAAIQINLATRRIRHLMGYSLKAYATPAAQEIASISPSAEECKSKIVEIKIFLEENPEIASKFDTLQDGSGCTGKMFLDAAKQILGSI